MQSPAFLTLPEVLTIHGDQLARYGGAAGMRDQGALQAALAMPQAGVGDTYVHADLYEMAAAYLFHIVQNHPFVDGNKRTGAVAAMVFLALNGIQITAPEAAFERLVWSTAEGERTKADIAKFFRAHCQPQ